VLKNFLSNAVKFTERGAVTLKAAAAPPPYAVALVVEDTGIGIPQAKHEAVFEAFQQADGSTSRRYGGTGLGLTISRQLAELLGGDIRLLSTPGRGSSFSLLLPAVCAREEARQAAAPYSVLPAPEEEAEPAVEDLYALQGLQVLLMEPDVRTQLRLSGLLRTWGMRLHLADDLEEAIETLDELESVDFLLIDALMPGNDACVTIQKLREHLGEATVMIAMVPPDREDARDACLGHGVDGFVTTSCEPRELSEVLIRHLPTTVE
jgi:CheY-like chemotaxis protein